MSDLESYIIDKRMVGCASCCVPMFDGVAVSETAYNSGCRYCRFPIDLAEKMQDPTGRLRFASFGWRQRAAK